MARNQPTRIAKLEDKMGTAGRRRLVIPLHAYYAATDNNCTCRPYYTSTPFVIKKGMDDFYKEANNPSCPTPPDDAEFIDDIGAKETA